MSTIRYAFAAALIWALSIAGCTLVRAQAGATVVTTCGTLPQAYAPGGPRPIVQDINGNLCTNAAGGGGGGGAVTIIDGGDVTQGAKADAACATDTGTCTEIALLKRALQSLTSVISGVTAATPAGENHIGEVGGNMIPISLALTTSISTVTTGKSIGGLQTLTNAVRASGAVGTAGTSGIIQSTMITFADAIGTVPFDVYYFNATPSGSTCTDNTTFALVNADRDKVIGIAHVTDITASNTVAIAQANNLAIPFGVASATSIFACVVTRGSAAIATASSAVSLLTRILRN